MFSRLTLKKKLTYTASLAVLVGTFLVAMLAFISAGNRLDVEVEERVKSATASYDQYVSDWLKSKGNALTALPSDANKADIVRHLKQVRDSAKFDNVFLAYPDGSQQNANGVVLPPGNDDPRKWGWYINASKDPRSVFMDNPTVAAATGANVVSLGQALNLQGEQVVLGADVELKAILDNQKKVILPGEGFMFLANKEGNVFAYEDTKLLNKSVSELGIDPADMKQALTAKGTVRAEIAGNDSVLYASAIPGTKLVTVVVLNHDSLVAPLYQAMISQLVITLIIVALCVVLIGMLINALFRPLLNVSEALTSIAKGGGDLTQRIPVDSDDEVGKLATSFNQFLESQQQLIRHVRAQSEELTGAATQGSERSNLMVRELNQQQSEISMVATAVTEMASAAQEIASNAEQTAHSAQESSSGADTGRQIVLNTKNSINNLAEEITQASDVINELNQHVQEISTILATIQGVAEQTNLLALNAAIEAARAGEQGRGFAVVADEVRVLSQRTHKSTEEIQTMIDTLHQTMGRAVDLMGNSSELAHKSVGDADEAAASLEEINRSIALISDMATQIATAVEEQTHVTGEITQNVTAIKDVSDALAENASDGLKESEKLNEQATSLNSKVDTFRV